MSRGLGDVYKRQDYNNILVPACAAAGFAAFTGDGTNHKVMEGAAAAITACGGAGIPTVKPWDNATLARKIALARSSGCFAMAMDIDAAGLPFLQHLDPPAGSKTAEQLKEIALAAGVPFILKGIMTVKGAEKAIEAGAAGIVVSNHGGRVLDDSKPKYVNSPETLVYHKSDTVFALQIAKRSASHRYVLCEGYMDVISMHQAGIDTAVCACGTALTPDQVKLISQYADEVILSYDSDEAGQKATLRSLELFRNSPVRVGVLQIPGAKDPDEYIKKYGADRFKALLDGVGNALDFRLGRLRSQYDLKQDAQRLEYVKEAVEMLAQRSNPTEQEVYAGRLAEETNISKTAIMAQLADAVKKAGSWRRREQNRARLKEGEMDQIKVPYGAGRGALGMASAEQRLLAAMLREPGYIDKVSAQLRPEQFLQPQQKELYEAMLRCKEQGVEVSLATLRAFVSEEALNELSRLAAKGKGSVQIAPAVTKAIAYIDENYMKQPGLESISKAAGVSSQHLCRLFRQTLNCRPMEYITKRKIQAAKMLLAETQKTVDQIAEETGFCDSSYFCKIFKRFESITPSQFRSIEQAL